MQHNVMLASIDAVIMAMFLIAIHPHFCSMVTHYFEFAVEVGLRAHNLTINTH